MNSNNNKKIPTKTLNQPWIYVQNNSIEIEEDTDEELSDEDYIRKIFKENKKFHDVIGRIIGEKKDMIERLTIKGKKEILPLCEESIDRIAEEANCKVGKWMLFIPKEKVDAVWNNIAYVVINNKLGSAISAKVATALQGSNPYVICVYTNNYLDIKDVMDVREKLRELGFTQILYYKPDIYTHLEIYSQNPFVKASRYKS